MSSFSAVPPFSQAQLDDIYALAIDTAKGAGKLLLDAVDDRCHGAALGPQLEKLNAVDLVTHKDQGTSAHRLLPLAASWPCLRIVACARLDHV